MLNALEREFLQASQALAQREEAEREAARQRELELAQEKAEVEEWRAKEQAQAANRLRTRNQIITAVGALALIAAIAAGVLGRQSESNAQHARQNAATAEAASTHAIAQQATAISNANARATAETIAKEQRQMALARQLAAQAQVLLSSGNGLSLTHSILLGVESLKRLQTDDGDQVLRQGLALLPRLTATITQED